MRRPRGALMPHKTLLMEAIELEYGINIPRRLHARMRAGALLREIADELGISVTTASRWTRDLGLSRAQAAALAWQHNLIPEAEVGPRPPHRARGIPR